MTRSWYSSGQNDHFEFQPYVSIAERRRQAYEHVEALRKKGRVITPVVIEGRAIAKTFWGKAWCSHLETHSDFATRMPRGRTYVRNGSVVHLDVAKGEIAAIVAGSSMYEVAVTVTPLAKPRVKELGKACGASVASVVELLEGRLPKGVLAAMTHAQGGLFPGAGEIALACTCPDWARMCKHVAAVLYGVGARLDARPELLFVLRGVDTKALVTASLAKHGKAARKAPKRVLASKDLGSVFGIEMEIS